MRGDISLPPGAVVVEFAPCPLLRCGVIGLLICMLPVVCRLGLVRRPWGLRTGEAVKALAIASHVLRSGVLPSFRSYTLTKNSRSACVKRKPAETKSQQVMRSPLESSGLLFATLRRERGLP